MSDLRIGGIMKLLQCYIDDIIKTALMEDINYIDAAADNLIPPEHTSSAYYVAKDSGVVCGIEIAKRVFEMTGGNVLFNILINDGEKVKKGDIIAELEGSTLTMLKGERTALNILQHMSGIATATNKCVELVEGTKASVTDTRKTLPGLRALQKYAVTVGGGKNHRHAQRQSYRRIRRNYRCCCGIEKTYRSYGQDRSGSAHA